MGLVWSNGEPVPTLDVNTKNMVRQRAVAIVITNHQEELDKAGLRLQNVYRAIQIRNYDRNRDLEWNEVVPFFKRQDGTTGAVIDEDKFAVMVDNFYELHGWDKTTGWPTRATLEELDLKNIADELQAIDKLP